MIAEPAEVFGNRVFVAPPRHEEIDELGERGENIDEAEARHRAAHVEVGEKRFEHRNRLREVVPLPEGRPRDQDQEKACFEQEGDQKQTSKQGARSRDCRTRSAVETIADALPSNRGAPPRRDVPLWRIPCDDRIRSADPPCATDPSGDRA